MKLIKLSITVLLIQFTFHLYSQIPTDYYNNIDGLSGENLKEALHNIIKGHTEFPYTSSSTDTWDILKESDADTTNAENVLLIYSGWSVNAAQEYNSGTGWSREHVWAKSHGDFGTSKGAGTDCHHLTPCDISVNSARGNKDFDNGGEFYIDGDGETLCKSDPDSWEARPSVRGDVARKLFYMAVRYEGEGNEPDLELVDEVKTADLNEEGKGFHGKLSTLMEWNISDPVDSFEINRNNVIYKYQKNRNPFIDHPEFVNLIWGEKNGYKSFDNNHIFVYPNPADDFINIYVPIDKPVTVSLHSLDGKAILRQDLFDNFKIQTSHLEVGLYMLRVRTFEGIAYNTKLMIL